MYHGQTFILKLILQKCYLNNIKTLYCINPYCNDHGLWITYCKIFLQKCMKCKQSDLSFQQCVCVFVISEKCCLWKRQFHHISHDHDSYIFFLFFFLVSCIATSWGEAGQCKGQCDLNPRVCDFECVRAHRPEVKWRFFFLNFFLVSTHFFVGGH